MSSKYLALLSCILFIASYLYFLYIGSTVYEPGADARYLLEVTYATLIPLILSVVSALVIWLVKRQNYAIYLFRSLIFYFVAGIAVDLFATYLMLWSVRQ